MINPGNSDQYRFGPVGVRQGNREMSAMVYDSRYGDATFQQTYAVNFGNGQFAAVTGDSQGMMLSMKPTYEQAQSVINLYTDPSGLTQSCMCDCMYCRQKKYSVVEREECNAGIFLLLLLLFLPGAFIYCLCITRYAVHHCGNCGKVLGRTPIS